MLDNSGSLSSSGFLGGGTAGINYQFPGTNYVLGAEGDFDGSTVRTNAGGYDLGGGAIPNDTKLDWFATARARFGYAFGNILPYVTGGASFGHVDQYRVEPGGDPFGNFSVGSTRTGWTAGAGIEYQVTRNLSVKAEYLHVDLGPQYYQTPGELTFAPANDHSAHPTLNVVRAGVNWRFEWLTPQRRSCQSIEFLKASGRGAPAAKLYPPSRVMQRRHTPAPVFEERGPVVR